MPVTKSWLLHITRGVCTRPNRSATDDKHEVGIHYDIAILSTHMSIRSQALFEKNFVIFWLPSALFLAGLLDPLLVALILL